MRTCALNRSSSSSCGALLAAPSHQKVVSDWNMHWLIACSTGRCLVSSLYDMCVMCPIVINTAGVLLLAHLGLGERVNNDRNELRDRSHALSACPSMSSRRTIHHTGVSTTPDDTRDHARDMPAPPSHPRATRLSGVAQCIPTDTNTCAQTHQLPCKMSDSGGGWQVAGWRLRG